VDFIAGRISLRAGETENDEAREIPIEPPLRVLLKEQLAKREPACQYVCFRVDRSGKSVKIESFQKSWYMVPNSREYGQAGVCAAARTTLKGKTEDNLQGNDFPRSSPDGGPQSCGGRRA
jgi:hypothetical protein